jgi:RNA polymerase-binding transcription factor DksA
MPVNEINNESVAAIDATLRQVEKALDRLRQGTYRVCESCQTPLAESVLAADPLRTTCDAHLELR